MTNHLNSYFGKGLEPKAFIEAMTRNQDKFLDWYHRFEWPSQDDQAFFRSLTRFQSDLHCLIIAADWCGDVVRNVPVVFRVLEEAGMKLDVLIMEQNLELIDQFLTLGGRSIPVVLFTDGQGNLLGKWGPRPTYVQEPMVQFKQTHTDREAPDYEEHLKATRMQIMERYGEDTTYQKLIVEELKQLLEGLFPSLNS